MESKYYTPDISEFYVGFEFEQIEIVGKSGYSEEDWVTNICTPGFGAFDEDIDSLDDGYIRVKYLDKSDIESLGFIYNNNYSDLPELGFINESKLESLNIQYLLYYNPLDNLTRIERIVNCGTGNEDYLFYGIIKNKSELIKLLKQLNIVDEEEKKP